MSMVIAALTAECFGAVPRQETTPFNWYCKRAENNNQPPIEKTMDFIEQYDGYFIDKRLNDDDVNRTKKSGMKKRLYLTFDAGYENGNIEKILDIMKENQVTGAFFILSNLIESNTELVKRMAQEGHTVCNHTQKHRDMTKVTDKTAFAEELAGLEQLYKDYVGHDMAKYYRPPEGRFSEQNLRYAQELGYKTIFWSFAYADWDNNKQPDPEAAKAKILKYTHNGAVLLLHPTSATNAAILGDLISEWKKQGYEFGTLDELTESGGEADSFGRVDTYGNVFKEHCNNNMKIALTFDDGPHGVYTKEILDILKEYDVKATFFVVGENVKSYPDLIQREIAEGHELGNHTYTHMMFNDAKAADVVSQIMQTEDLVYEISEYRLRLFRPPGGIYDDVVTKAAGRLDYNLILWNVDTRDWARTPTSKIVDTVMNNINSGGIILCHDCISNKCFTPEALRIFIPKLLEEGYNFVTVSELIMSR